MLRFIKMSNRQQKKKERKKYVFPAKAVAAVALVPALAVLSAAITANRLSSRTESGASGASGTSVSLPTVVIDAGHGGLDGGAVASDGTQEQYLNLDIAKKINSILTLCGIKTVMTRSDDNSIHDPDKTTVRDQKVSDIHNRMKIIESTEGCIFLSIHQNYFEQSQYSGTQVFYSDNNEQSLTLAQCIQESVVKALQPDNTRQVKPSGKSIYLLYYTTRPAALVECGFLSNEQETQKLKDEDYRRQMAMAICGGVLDFIFGEYPRESTSAQTVG